MKIGTQNFVVYKLKAEGLMQKNLFITNDYHYNCGFTLLALRFFFMIQSSIFVY